MISVYVILAFALYIGQISGQSNTCASNLNQCNSRGICMDQANGTICNCNDGYYGPHCEFVHFTTMHYGSCMGGSGCSNGGSCSYDSFSSRYYCLCMYPFYGSNCQYLNENATISCFSSPCLNGGSCQTNNNGMQYCTCPSGYSGIYCQKSNCLITGCTNTWNSVCMSNGSCSCSSNANYYYNYGHRCENMGGTICNSIRCENGGGCVSGDGIDYDCICPPDFYGEHCEYQTCAQNNCLNGGSCIATSNSTKCMCPDGYCGSKCEYKGAGELSLDPCASDPCENNGKCVAHIGFLWNTYSCDCMKGYVGDVCEFREGHVPMTHFEMLKSLFSHLKIGYQFNLGDN